MQTEVLISPNVSLVLQVLTHFWEFIAVTILYCYFGILTASTMPWSQFEFNQIQTYSSRCCDVLYIVVQVSCASAGGSLSLLMFVRRVLTVLAELTAASRSLYPAHLGTCVHLDLIDKCPAHQGPTRIYQDRCREWGYIDCCNFQKDSGHNSPPVCGNK